jgi:UDP-glucose 4-epimerase
LALCAAGLFQSGGVHESGMIDEDPNCVLNNLMPYLAQVAAGKLRVLSVYSNDWPTPDGNGVRDYIHVAELANGDKKVMEKLGKAADVFTCNLGAWRDYSMLDMIAAFEGAMGQSVPYRIVDKREDDIAACYANTNLAKTELGWEAARDLGVMCRDLWRRQQFCNKSVQ